MQIDMLGGALRISSVWLMKWLRDGFPVFEGETGGDPRTIEGLG